MELLEREELLASLSRAQAEAAGGAGRFVALAGEAGAGKSALVRAFAAAHPDVELRSGGCDPLTTPQPLGPLRDLAPPGSALAAALSAGMPPAQLFGVVLDDLRAAPAGTILVIEDAHWADEATLDLLRFLGRRVEQLSLLVLVTYRDDECGPAHPLRVVLGDLAGMPWLRRLHVPRLSRDAVACLAEGQDLDVAELHRRTGGNPFFVSEVLASACLDLPETVRDAVLARASRLDPDARELLDVVSAAPARTEMWLLVEIVGPALPGLDAAVASGMLVADRDTVRFRHELARLAIADVVPVARRSDLHRRLLDALGDPAYDVDPARLAHHAAAAGDVDALVRFAGAAARRSASLGAHREAAVHYEAVVRFGTDLPVEERATFLDLLSYECYLTGRLDDALSARTDALEAWQVVGDNVRIGAALRWVSRLSWFLARMGDARRTAAEAVEVLEREPPGYELAMAYSNLSQLAMLSDDYAGTVTWGERARALGEQIGDAAVVAHALNNMGSVIGEGRTDGPGWDMLKASLELALEHDLEEHAARAYTNMLAGAFEARDVPCARQLAETGIDYCAARDLDAWRVYMLGSKAQVGLYADDWRGAAADAALVLRDPNAPPVSRIIPLAVRGRVRARRGDPDVDCGLAEAWRLAQANGEALRQLPTLAALAEAAWLSDTTLPDDAVAGFARIGVAHSTHAVGELAVWAHRLGIPVDVDADDDVPYFVGIAGDSGRAVDEWLARGCRYEAALAAIDGDDVERLREAADWLTALGVRATLRKLSQRLRELGAPAVRGPRRATADNPAGLTQREVEVLTLLAEGLPNGSIADRLVVSQRTVDHHVSAVLRKLEVSSRYDAAAAAAELGLVGDIAG